MGADAESIARAVDRLLGDALLAAGLAEKAMWLAAEKYDWSLSARVHLGGIRQLMSPTPQVEASSSLWQKSGARESEEFSSRIEAENRR